MVKKRGIMKRKMIFIEENMPGNIDTVRRYIETPITFVLQAITKKHTRLAFSI